MNTLAKSLAVVFIGLIVSQSVSAKAITAKQMLKLKDVMIYEQPVVDTVKTTNWFATPTAILSENTKSKKPQIIALDVSSTGYYGAFDNGVVLNCLKPLQSYVKADNRKITFKESMAFEDNPYNDNFEYRLDRDAVTGLFSKFCK